MARLTGPISFTGKLQNLSARKRKGSKHIILQTRYGPSKHDIDTKPSYANTKRENKEFGGRSTASKWIRDGYYALRGILDPKNLNNLNALLMPIQLLDRVSAYGKRSVALSSARGLLEGFNINEWHPFDSVITNPIEAAITKEEFKASLTIPALLPQVNFFAPTQHPFFRIVACLSLVPDLYCNEPKYRPMEGYEHVHPAVVKTQWMAVQAGSEVINLELSMPQLPPGDHYSLVLTIGMEQGTAKSNTLIKGVKYAGAGKILKVG